MTWKPFWAKRWFEVHLHAHERIQTHLIHAGKLIYSSSLHVDLMFLLHCHFLPSQSRGSFRWCLSHMIHTGHHSFVCFQCTLSHFPAQAIFWPNAGQKKESSKLIYCANRFVFCFFSFLLSLIISWPPRFISWPSGGVLTPQVSNCWTKLPNIY